MDDQAAVIARRVAMSAAAWFDAPANIDAYRRLADAVGEWNAYCSPRIGDPQDLATAELLDELVDAAGEPPQPLGAGLADLEAVLMSKARRTL